MPNLDKTGPIGQGPRTGRGFGPCGSGMRQGWGCGGCGCRCGRGFGFRRFFSPKNELSNLEEQEKILEEELEAIREEKASLANEGK